MGREKATKVEQRLHAQQVMEWMVQGWSRQKIRQEGCRLWGYTNERSIDRIIKIAREDFVAAWEGVERKEFVCELLEKFNHLYERGLEQRQLAVSHASLTAQAKLMGLDSPMR